MKTRILNTDYVSFKFFLKDLSIQQQLQKQLSRLLINLQFFKEPSLNLTHKILAVSRLSSSTPITYRCAIAMQLSSKLSLSPIEIAQQVFSVLKAQSNLDDQEFSQLTLTMKLIDPGWLDFEVSDHTLVLWLELLGQKIFSQPNLSKISGKADNLFLIEYTYARSRGDRGVNYFKIRDFGRLKIALESSRSYSLAEQYLSITAYPSIRLSPN
jgi:hypothetical protein